MGCRYPLLAFVFGALASNRYRRAMEDPSSRISVEFVSATTSTECAALACAAVAPITLWAAIGPAIDDNALPVMAHLKGERARMGMAVETRRWAATGIDDDQAFTGLQPLESPNREHGDAGGRSFPIGSVPDRSEPHLLRTESLNSARRRSPWRNSRSIGAARSIVFCSAPGGQFLRHGAAFEYRQDPE